MNAQNTMIAARPWANTIAMGPEEYRTRPSTYARLRPNRSPTLLPIRMNAADTSASSAIAPCTPLTLALRSRTTEEIETFINDVSTTNTNIAAAKSRESRGLPLDSAGALVPARSVNFQSRELFETLRHDDAPGGLDQSEV